MVEKYDSIVALAVEHALALAAKPETYLSFLTTAANNRAIPFAPRFTQRPCLFQKLISAQAVAFGF